jgi:hypothetical protein
MAVFPESQSRQLDWTAACHSPICKSLAASRRERAKLVVDAGGTINKLGLRDYLDNPLGRYLVGLVCGSHLLPTSYPTHHFTAASRFASGDVGHLGLCGATKAKSRSTPARLHAVCLLAACLSSPDPERQMRSRSTPMGVPFGHLNCRDELSYGETILVKDTVGVTVLSSEPSHRSRFPTKKIYRINLQRRPL